MAEGVGFEPTVVLPTTAFKAATISRTLPTLRMAGTAGIEPATTRLTAVRSTSELHPNNIMLFVPSFPKRSSSGHDSRFEAPSPTKERRCKLTCLV